MNREEKNAIINSLTEKINRYNHFYLADISELNADDTSKLRRKCFEKNISLVVAKNTLLKLALEKAEGNYEQLYYVLKGATSVMFVENASVPGKLIKEFRKDHDKPLLKGAYVEESIYVGDEFLDVLATMKSKEELIADVIALLQSPVKNVISALKSGGHIIAGIVETLSEREE
ncbi:MAG: 50S ribosomal protein L10 [Bacteroidetes bacterium]|nr:50S ribosomal protein L10 [Bacteroidota bacterium]